MMEHRQLWVGCADGVIRVLELEGVSTATHAPKVRAVGHVQLTLRTHGEKAVGKRAKAIVQSLVPIPVPPRP